MSVLAAAVGHLDSRRSIQRVIGVTFTVSFAYSLTQVQTQLFAVPLGHIRDVVLVGRNGNINRTNYLCATVVCTVRMVHIGTSSSYGLVDLILLDLALYLPSASVSSVFMVLCIFNRAVND